MEDRLGFPFYSAFITWPGIALLIVLYIAYFSDVLVGGDRPLDPAAYVQRSPAQGDLSPAQQAEIDDSDDLPGDFVRSQGKQHAGDYPLQERIEFCSGEPIADECYASNPPSSGRHVGVQRDVTLESGEVVDLPPSPGIYDFVVPREVIPHIQEHAGVYVGYNCGDDACRDVARELRGLVEVELAQGRRVVLSPDPDLNDGAIGLASWTRVDVFDAAAFDADRVRDFIRAHSCRFDPEGFCDEPLTN